MQLLLVRVVGTSCPAVAIRLTAPTPVSRWPIWTGPPPMILPPTPGTQGKKAGWVLQLGWQLLLLLLVSLPLSALLAHFSFFSKKKKTPQKKTKFKLKKKYCSEPPGGVYPILTPTVTGLAEVEAQRQFWSSKIKFLINEK